MRIRKTETRLIFVKGVSVIEKTYKKEELEKDFKIHDYTNQIKIDRKSLKTMRKEAGSTGKWNTKLKKSGYFC